VVRGFEPEKETSREAATGTVRESICENDAWDAQLPGRRGVPTTRGHSQPDLTETSQAGQERDTNRRDVGAAHWPASLAAVQPRVSALRVASLAQMLRDRVRNSGGHPRFGKDNFSSQFG
jgi:hypothetical protein